jgi:probable rRNA maturation factor
MSTEIQVDVQIASKAGSVPQLEDINGWIAAAIAAVDPGSACEVSVRIVDEDEGRSLNREYRNKDYATNVMSFSAGAAPSSLPPDVPKALGDIVICGPVVEKEAAAQNKTVADHWGHLLVHGTLHLLGHDHEDDQSAAAMELIETGILTGKGVPNPYDC